MHAPCLCNHQTCHGAIWSRCGCADTPACSADGVGGSSDCQITFQRWMKSRACLRAIRACMAAAPRNCNQTLKKRSQNLLQCQARTSGSTGLSSPSGVFGCFFFGSVPGRLADDHGEPNALRPTFSLERRGHDNERAGGSNKPGGSGSCGCGDGAPLPLLEAGLEARLCPSRSPALEHRAIPTSTTRPSTVSGCPDREDVRRSSIRPFGTSSSPTGRRLICNLPNQGFWPDFFASLWR